jgi:hypothetical protein
MLQSVLGIRNRTVLGLPDPDPFVRGTDPDPAPDQEKIKFVRLRVMCLLVSF